MGTENLRVTCLAERTLAALVMAGLLFYVYGLLNPDDDEAITVDPATIRQLTNHFQRTWMRPPTSDEQQSLIRQYVLDEIYVREARALGLDVQDEVIRNRLRQKMQFLQADAAVLEEPSGDELQAFLMGHADLFKTPDRYRFHQVYLNADRDEASWQAVLSVQQARIAAGEVPQGDASLLPGHFDDATAFDVNRVLGDGFSQQLDDLPFGTWTGPLRSGLGWHFVLLESRTAGELPSLDIVREKVLLEWQRARKQQRMQEHEAALLSQYRVTIEWPKGEQP